MSNDFNQVDHFVNECKECESLVYKGCLIEHFLPLIGFEELKIETRVVRAGGVNICISVEVFLYEGLNKVKSLGKVNNFYSFKDFLRSFSYPSSGRLKTTMRRKNNNHIFKFIRRNLNQIILSYDKSATGKFTINSLNLTREKELKLNKEKV